MLPFNKRPARDASERPNGDPSDADSSQQRRSVPPPARSQPRLEEKPAPARAFQASLSDEEVTTFMASPAKKSSRSLLAESGETRTAAKHIRPPAPSIVDEDEDEGRTQVRAMPKGGKLSLPTSSVSIAKVREREPASDLSSPSPAARKDLRVPEISLPKAAAALTEMPILEGSEGSGADAPDFTMQLGPSVKSAPPQMKSVPPPMVSVPQMSTHQFAPVTSAPLRSQPPPAMASTAMLGQGGMQGGMQGPMSAMPPSSSMMGQGPMAMGGMGPAAGSPMMGQMQPMSPAMMSGQVPAMAMPQQGPFDRSSLSGGFPQQPGNAHMSGGYSASSGGFPGSPLDPPGTAVSLSRAAPKPARGWLMAAVAVAAVAAIVVFGVTSHPGAQATTASFVDPSHAPGEAAQPPGAPPAGQGAAGAQPAVATTPPALTPAELLAQPTAPAVPPTPQPVVAPVVAPVVPAPVNPVAVAPPPTTVANQTSSKPPAPQTPVAKSEVPKVVKVASVEPPREPRISKPPKPPATSKSEDGPKKGPASPGDKEMKDAADALARAQLEQSL